MTTTVAGPTGIDEADKARGATRLGVSSAAAWGIGVGVVVAVILALLTNLVVGIVVGVIAGLAVAAIRLALLRGTMAAILTTIGATPVSGDDHARYVNLVEGLCISSGITEAKLHVVADEGVNVLVAGPPEKAAMVVTSGALDELNRVELEGVLAAGLVRIRSNDAQLGTVAAQVICGPLMRNGPAVSGRPMWMVTPLASWRATRLRRVLGPQRDLLADIDAVGLTRYPPGLGDAFQRAGARGTSVATATWGAAHLWLLDPLGPAADGSAANGLNELFRTHADLVHRVDLMVEL